MIILLKLNEKEISLLVALITMILLIIFLFIYFTISYIENVKYKTKINNCYNGAFSFVIDYKNQTTSCFDLKNLKSNYKTSFEAFLGLFEKDERTVLRNWLFDLIDSAAPFSNEDDKNVILVNIISKNNRKKKNKRTILRCRGVDKNRKIIYLDGEFLLNTPFNFTTEKGKKIIKNNFYSLDQIKNLYDTNYFLKGTFYVIQLNKKKNTNDEFFNYAAIKYLIIDSLNKLYNNSLLYFFFSKKANEICFIDTHDISEYQLPKKIHVIQTLIDEVLEIKGYANSFEYYVYASFLSDLSKNFDNSYDIFVKLESIEKDERKKYSIYKKEQKKFLNFDDGYKNEVIRIIRNQKIDVKFRPIAHIANKRVVNIGYMTFINPVDTIFTSFNELKKYVTLNNLDKELFSLIIRKVLPTFSSEKDNSQQKLFLSIKIDQVSFAMKNLAHFSGVSEISIVLCFESSEFIDSEDDLDLLKKLKLLQEKGYELALFTRSDDYILKSKTYAIFDYFFFNSEVESNVKYNSASFLKAHRFLDKIVKYNAIIVSYDAPNMQAIELLVKSGIEYFSSDALSPKSSMLLPFDKKLSKKLLNMYKQ